MKVNPVVFPAAEPFSISKSSDRWLHWCLYTQANKLHEPEYLLPLAAVETEIAPFSYETERDISKSDDDLRAELEAFPGWNYQMEFKNSEVSTRGFRHDADWKVHRYRGSLFIRSLTKILGERLERYSVLDVGCACGLFSLEFANQGCKSVVGIDLRDSNIQQAQWLAETYGIDNARFVADSARNLDKYSGFDLTFCAGLLYHVTYPIELIKGLHDTCNEFLILDTNLANHPVSAFNLVLNRDTSYAAEGETSYEFLPNYRAVIDSLLAVGFSEIIELVGSADHQLLGYATRETRTFVAFKPRESHRMIRNSLRVKD
jgi:tRNA (mo5U34)-methyltransferase